MYPEYVQGEKPTDQMQRSLAQGIGGAFSLNDDPEEDKSLSVRFILEPRQNEAKSRQAGRLICDEVEVCEIRIPGSTDAIRNVVTDKERGRFPRSYAAFRRAIEAGGTEQTGVSGTPLKLWPMITAHPGLIEEANYKGIRTVEHIAQMSDGNVKTMGVGWIDLRNKARDWLKKAEDGSVVNRLRDELAERDRRLETLEKMLNTQAQEIAAARNGPLPAGPAVDVAALVREQVAVAMAAAQPAAPAPKRRGRPPKATEV